MVHKGSERRKFVRKETLQLPKTSVKEEEIKGRI